ncbi:unnamed protein product [Linum trigynum]|uniref:Uncharacterized protein n=1 Tax=Linum trigynum TaxID=586398 RepID=A0AAV2E3W2_9ROSI
MDTSSAFFTRSISMTPPFKALSFLGSNLAGAVPFQFHPHTNAIWPYPNPANSLRRSSADESGPGRREQQRPWVMNFLAVPSFLSVWVVGDGIMQCEGRFGAIWSWKASADRFGAMTDVRERERER